MILIFTYNERLITPVKHRRLCNDINRETGEIHKHKTLPGHFLPDASRKYHYARRTAKYIAKKLKKYGQQPDDVATGLLREFTRAKSNVTATYGGWRLYCKAPFPLNDARRKEMEIINLSEVRAYIKDMKKKYTSRVGLPQYARKRQTRIKP